MRRVIIIVGLALGLMACASPPPPRPANAAAAPVRSMAGSIAMPASSPTQTPANPAPSWPIAKAIAWPRPANAWAQRRRKMRRHRQRVRLQSASEWRDHWPGALHPLKAAHKGSGVCINQAQQERIEFSTSPQQPHTRSRCTIPLEARTQTASIAARARSGRSIGSAWLAPSTVAIIASGRRRFNRSAAAFGMVEPCWARSTTTGPPNRASAAQGSCR
jgi:hypothetical protein